MKKYLLIICLLTGSLTVQAYEVAGGQCGEYAFWGLTDDGVLTVYGAGSTYVYPDLPWFSLKSKIKKVIISEGITYVGGGLFISCGNIEEVEIAGSVESVGPLAFDGCGGIRKIILSEGIKRFDLCSFYCFSQFVSDPLISIPLILPSTTEFIGYRAFDGFSFKEVICLASVVPEVNVNGFSFNGSVLYVPEESVNAYRADAIWSKFGEILGLNSVKRMDTLRLPVYVDVYDIVHHRVDIYDTVHTQVLYCDSMESELYDYTVVFDTIYKTYKVWVNDYDTVTAYVTDTIYTDTIYSNNYIHENIFVYDTVTGYIFDESVYLEEMNPAGILNVIQKDETVEIFSIDGHSAGHHRMDNMPGLSPGIYILRSLRTDNRLKIRVK